MAKRERRMGWPRCPQPRKDETPCGSSTRPDALGEPAADGLCVPHAPKIEEASPLAPPAPEASPEVEIPPTAVIATIAVESLRDSLRSGLLTEQTAELMQGVLIDALAASRNVSSTCPRCNHRHDLQLPDLNTRVSAVSKLLDQLEGAAKQSQESAQDAVAREATKLLVDLRELSDEDLAERIVRLQSEVDAERGADAHEQDRHG
jgi:hypothetical protein